MTITGLSCLVPGSRVIGYVTSAADGEDTDDESAAAIDVACERSNGTSSRSSATWIRARRSVGRLCAMCSKITEGQPQGLVVSDLRRLGHSIVELGTLMARFRAADAALIALDPDLDTSTTEGPRWRARSSR